MSPFFEFPTIVERFAEDFFALPGDRRRAERPNADGIDLVGIAVER